MLGAVSPWARAIAAIAMLKITLGLATAATIGLNVVGTAVAPRFALMLAHVVAYTAAAALLIVGGRSDRRAGLLGTVFLLVASVFADQLIAPLRTSESGIAIALRGVFAMQVDAFTPYFLWLFVRDFPRVPEDGTTRRRLNFIIRLSLGAGALLLAANVMLFLASPSGALQGVEPLLRHLSRYSRGGVYWGTQFTLSIIALPTLIWKARRAPTDERRRAFLLVAALVAGTGPTILWVLLQAFSESVATVLPLRRVGWVLYPTLLSTPFTTAYAVVVRRALDITLVIRRAVQYALARYSVMAAATVPVVLLVVSIYRNRDESVAHLLSSPAQVVLAALAVGGLVTLRSRSQVLDRIDRRFFREQYDSRQILGQLVDRCRLARDTRELAEVIGTEVDRALHLEAVAVLFLDRARNAFISPASDVRPLDARSALVALANRTADAVDVDLEHPSPVSHGLPSEDLHWIIDGAFKLLIPLRDPDRRLIGVLALGEKKSELPFSKEDESLLAAVGAATEITAVFRGIAAEPRDTPESVPVSGTVERCAAECGTCGTVFPTDTMVCGR
ncbi:MAG: Serine/threonine protein kinase, partial [Geminicoccaceae bacterium]|nr:Serine/threonine protein kinase [Geminicoccaceae bacterium]